MPPPNVKLFISVANGCLISKFDLDNEKLVLQKKAKTQTQIEMRSPHFGPSE